MGFYVPLLMEERKKIKIANVVFFLLFCVIMKFKKNSIAKKSFILNEIRFFHNEIFETYLITIIIC